MRNFGAVAGAVVMMLGARAYAGSGAAPAKVWLDSGIPVQGVEEQRLVEAGGAWLPVIRKDAAAAVNPGGIAVIRGGNHVIPRASASQTLNLLRAVGDEAGDVFVWYTATNGQGGHSPHLRRVKPDNSLGFDQTVLVERLAGVAADGAGGAYVASHVAYASEGVWADMTKHRTIRVGPEGQVLWQVEEAGAKKPYSSSEYWSSATRGGAGVLVGYGVSDGQGVLRPVAINRAAADGAAVWRSTGLKAPGLTAASQPSGALGTTALVGRVESIHVAQDGTPILVVYADGAGDSTITRLDAGGQQTAAFGCGSGNRTVMPAPGGQVACVLGRPAKNDVEVARYGVVGGALVQISRFTTEPIAGWSFSQVAYTSGGQLLVAGQKNGATLTMALFSGAGKLLAKYDQGVAGKVLELGARNGSWIGLGHDVLPEHLHFRGTYTAGGTLPPLTPRLPGPIPIPYPN